MEKFNSLELQDQQLIIDICDELSKRSVSAAIERDKKYLDLLEDNGVEIVEFKQEELEALAKATREISWPKMYERLSEELMNTLRQGLE
jgi:TRAP-type C4-dicarboxylate transport system substrate-binding protein